VTVAAVDAIARYMTFVAELDRLLARHVHLRNPWRSVDLIGEVEKSGDEEERAENADPGYRVRAAMKNLRHIPKCTSPRQHITRRTATPGPQIPVIRMIGSELY
jgi:hypothetical protein